MQEKGASIPDYVIDDRLQAIIREEFGGDRAAFVRTLQAQGFTVTRFKEIEREKIIVQAMRQPKVENNFVISPTQIQAYYDKNKSAYATPEQVKLRMIVIREGSSGDVPDVGSKKELAEEIRQKVASGAEFDRMAEMYRRTRRRSRLGETGAGSSGTPSTRSLQTWRFRCARGGKSGHRHREYLLYPHGRSEGEARRSSRSATFAMRSKRT